MRDKNKIIPELESKVKILEKLVETLQNQLIELSHQTTSHTLRLNNGEELSLEYITRNSKYQDLSPEKAYEFYNHKNRNFILLDVSENGFTPIADLPEALIIPLEELSGSLSKMPNRATSILVISEDGVRSIRACEILHREGYFNVNNISGGYKYWPGYNNLSHLHPSTAKSA